MLGAVVVAFIKEASSITDYAPIDMILQVSN